MILTDVCSPILQPFHTHTIQYTFLLDACSYCGRHAVLSMRGGPTDVNQFAVINYIGSDFRNGKIHPQRANPYIFTDRGEMRRARKLILGTDEEFVDSKPFLSRIRNAPWLSTTEGVSAYNTLEANWATFPGLLPLWWQAFGRKKISATA